MSDRVPTWNVFLEPILGVSLSGVMGAEMTDKRAKSPSLLRAFRHPAILLSIATLLLNDHLFKTLTPSWATGKISDFAGLSSSRF